MFSFRKSQESKIRKYWPDNIPFPKELSKLCEWRKRNKHPFSGSFELSEGDDELWKYWFGFDEKETNLALGVFGVAGDGSLFCIWDEGNEKYPVVYIGSEGDTYVIADNFLEFLKFLGIGYPDYYDVKKYYRVPKNTEKLNPEFRIWLEEEFDLIIPKDGKEIVQKANENHKDITEWVDKMTQKYTKP